MRHYAAGKGVSRRVKALLLLRCLDIGGAQRQVILLAKAMREKGHDVAVAVFYSGGALESELYDADVRVYDLGKSGRWDIQRFGARWYSVVRGFDPDVVYGFLSGPNLFALTAKLMSRRVRVAWGIRNSFMDMSHADRFENFLYKLEIVLSRVADVIIVNSKEGYRFHMCRGMSAKALRVVPNGVDLTRFHVDPDNGRAVRESWGVPMGVPLVGMVGRLDSMKGIPTFLRAAGEILKTRADVKFVCVGDGNPEYSKEVKSLAATLGLRKHLVWAGWMSDMRGVFNALDVLVSSSVGEGFSNVICEAMACGTPCVVTDVGDSAEIVSETGVVVEKEDEFALANGIAELVDRSPGEKKELREACVRRVEENYGVQTLVNGTVEALCPAD